MPLGKETSSRFQAFLLKYKVERRVSANLDTIQWPLTQALNWPVDSLSQSKSRPDPWAGRQCFGLRLRTGRLIHCIAFG